MPLAPGSRLDSYEIIAPLGVGGMGEVYRARDVTLKRDVAIKVLPEYWSRDPDRLRRFEQEAQATAALNHPNIVSIFHVGQYDGSPYIVTELLQGETLRDRLRKGPMRLREVLDFGGELARGLAAAHDAGIVHRDLKPENIWVMKDGRVKILDFGLAKLDPAKAASSDGETVSVQPQSHPGHVVGTVGYMSPEQVRGHVADARSDIFAVGVILYEMLTGKPAFRKATAAETMTAILNEDPLPVSQIAPSIEPGLQRIVNRCLAKSPEQRFQHASDLAFALEALSDSDSSPIAAINQGSRSRWVWVSVTAAIVALAAGLVGWWRIPPAVPVVESITQLTDDGEPKQGRLGSDGSRVYFNEGQTKSWKIVQVSVSGGRTARIDTQLVDPGVTALAPDGSALLAILGGTDSAAGPLWSIPLPAGEPRRLGGDAVSEATYFPDGRLLFTQGRDFYVADKDGTNPHRLLSVAAEVGAPSVSSDGKRIVFTMIDTAGSVTGHGELKGTGSLAELATDGTGLHTILNASRDEKFGAAVWSSDGKYLVCRMDQGRRSDLWALPVQTGLFHQARGPIRLTNGPLSYSGALPSRDGKQIFAIGTKQHGELVRYDMKSQQFVQFLSGISAIDPTFSRDGQWVAYTSFPDHTLWRSRSDGTERKQLTYTPMEVAFPFISPDGTKVAFTTSSHGTYVVNMDGGQPQRIAENSGPATWSPDGNRLLFATTDPPCSEKKKLCLHIFDARTGNMSVVPSSQGMIGPLWVTQDTLVAVDSAVAAVPKFLTFDFKTQRWNDLVAGNYVNWQVSPGGKYLVFTTGGAEPKVQRLRFADRQIETITSLKDLRRVVDSVEGQTQVDVAPDGSPVFTRDIGTQEIYALTVKWP